MKNYFNLEANELLINNKVPYECFEDSETVFEKMALEMVECIEENNKNNRPTVLIIPVGPVGQYPYFVDIVNKKQLSLKNCYFLNMDEYLDDNKQYIDINNKLSFRGFMEKQVYNKIQSDLTVPPNQRFFPDPQNPESLQNVIDEIGPVDIAFGGIGINGHVAFNEAEDGVAVEEFSQRETRVIKISSETRVANAIGDLNGAIDAMPNYAATIGMRQILGAKKIRLCLFREWQRSVLRQTLFGKVESHFPSTILQNHPDAKIYSNKVVSIRPF
ncbi:MAG: glucosamine-6-phosphate isomerase [Pleomorphochaeta sp.]